jgi:hypothetical protein
VVSPVGRDDRAQIRHAAKKSYGKPRMHQTIVDDDVGDPEGRHADADAEEDLAPGSLGPGAAVENERDRDRRVQHAERVVALEAPGARDVMGAVNGPQRAVPHGAVEEGGPEVHRDGDRGGHRAPDERMLDGSAHGDLRGAGL